MSRTIARTTLWMASLLAALSLHTGAAQAHGPYGGVMVAGPVVYGQLGAGYGHWRGGRYGGGLGIGFGVPVYYPQTYGVYGTTVLGAPAPLAYAQPWQEPVPLAAPDPVFQPRQAQTASQIEADRQDCNRWAIGQPGAMPDARVFHRATLACMESKGYNIR